MHVSERVMLNSFLVVNILTLYGTWWPATIWPALLTMKRFNPVGPGLITICQQKRNPKTFSA